MKIGFYGQIASCFGGPTEIALPEQGETVTALRRRLALQCDANAILETTIRAAVNDQIVPEAHRVLPGDRVEFLSPVSGG
ncbi:MoaD/ThiS family protein [Maricaulis sp. CAU 1757]